MKFLMKIALDSINPSDTSSHFSSFGPIPVDTVLSACLRHVENLRRHLHSNYLSWSLINRLNNILQKTCEAHRVSTKEASEIEFMPFIKATTVTEKSAASNGLTGQSILCVGGRAKLYPVYRRLVEESGGRLMTFYGNSDERIDQLLELLAFADMVICPVDCVNHEAYFTVKRYCKRTKKLCVLLDRSHVVVFQKGVETLTRLTAKQAKA